MKKLLIVAALTATLSAPAFAADKPKNRCVEIYNLAQAVMEVRQRQVSINLVMGESPSETLRPIVIDAYSQPAYSGDEYQKSSVDKFANKYALACYSET
jgi:opacity protein-like surface antigen